MDLEPTLRETDDAQADLPTLLEDIGFDALTVREAEPSTSPAENILLVPNSVFGKYRLIRPLSVTSGEADLWLIEESGSGARCILKYYRYGIFPKAEIVERLRQVRRDHIVDIIEVGHKGDRVYEIQEYVSHGSLGDWMKQGIGSPETARSILAEIAEALAHLHSHEVLHRDIKPSNILVRSREPADLVLTDFGISSISAEVLHLTSKQRTPAYCAPEALTGIVTKASDWWSVGVILLEILLQHHPLRGFSEQMVNFQLVTKGLSVPSDLPVDWQLLLKGLLTRDYARRWTHEQIFYWLGGRRDLAVYYQDPATLGTRPQKPYKFAGQEFFDPPALAESLALNWADAIKQVAFGYVTRWVETEVQDQALAVTLRDISYDRNLTPGQKLAATLLALNPNLPLLLDGEVVDSNWCAQHVRPALELTNSSLPRWLSKIRGDSSLLEWRKEYDALQAGLVSYQVPLNQDVIQQLFSADQNQVIEAALGLRHQFAGSAQPRLAALLEAPRLDFTQALVLLACDRSLFLTKIQFEHSQKLEHLRGYGCHIDLPFAERLLRADGMAALQPLWHQAQRHYLLRRESFLSLENQRLAGVLECEQPDLVDMAAVLANRLAFRNSLGQIFIPIKKLRVLFGLHLVRQEDFRQFAEARRIYWKPPKFDTGPDHPILNVRWDEAEAFCEWLTDRDRKQKLIGSRDFYRLPADTEWSMAAGLENEPGATPLARASKIKSIYPWGQEWPPPAGATQFSPSSGPREYPCAAPVGFFPANHQGVFDLGVNVMEWSWDWDDPDMRTKVVRGAAWCHAQPEEFLTSVRRFFIPTHRSDAISFRTVLVVRSFKSLIPVFSKNSSEGTGDVSV